MQKTLQKIIRYTAANYRRRRCVSAVGSKDWGRRLAKKGLPSFPVHATADRRLDLPELSIEIDEEHSFVLDAYKHFEALRASGFTLGVAEKGEIEVDGRGVRASLNSVEEAYIFREIFSDRTYDVQPAHSAQVIDIGMNIGLASIFFASIFPDCKVNGFEPFSETFNRARYQLSLNPALASRITPHNFGLWKTTEERQVETDMGHKGSTGIWGISKELKSTSQPQQDNSNINLRDASVILGPILDDSCGKAVILKLDAEGSEYGIFENLAKSGLADRFDVILMEWHRNQPDHDPLKLRDLLSNLGYKSLCQGGLHRSYGMIYAFR